MKSQVYQVELSRADYAVGLSALVAELARVDTARGRVLFARLAAGVAALILIAFAFPFSFPALVTAAMLIWFADMLVLSAFKTQTVGVSFDPAAHARNRIEFSDDSIVEQGELRARHWTWDAVRRVHLSSGHVVIELKGWDMIVLPNRLWPTPAERSAFVAELEARRRSSGTRMSIPSPAQAEARATLIEPVLLARVSLALAAFHLIFEVQLPFGADRSAAYIALGIALLGGAIMWWTSGKAFDRLTARSPSASVQIAWLLFALLAMAFLLRFQPFA